MKKTTLAVVISAAFGQVVMAQPSDCTLLPDMRAAEAAARLGMPSKPAGAEAPTG